MLKCEKNMTDSASHDIVSLQLNASAEVKVLIVDDSRSLRRVLKRELGRMGIHSTEFAQDGVAAIEALRKEVFDLILLDIEMPNLDGIGVLKLLKADPDLKDIPVIVISGFDYLDQSIQCIRLGAEDYLPKPFSSVLLQTRVFVALAKKRA
jgi:CheY-like chemotaxis protein